MTQTKKIYVAGHRGMVGSAIVRQLQGTASCLAVTDKSLAVTDPVIAIASSLAMTEAKQSIITRTHAELDLTNQAAVNAFFAAEQPDEVYLAAAKVGGIHANNVYPADFIYDNLMIQSNVIQAAHTHGVQRLLFLGSSCIYPKAVERPMREEALLSGALYTIYEVRTSRKVASRSNTEINLIYASSYASCKKHKKARMTTAAPNKSLSLALPPSKAPTKSTPSAFRCNRRVPKFCKETTEALNQYAIGIKST